MQFFKDFLDKKIQDDIEKAMLKLPWYFNTIEDDLGDISSKTPIYFVNLLGCESHGTSSQDIKQFVPLLFKLEEMTKRKYIDRIVRVKANLYTRRPDFEKNHFHKPHIDLYNKETMIGDEGEVFLYYANTSDGDTVFMNEGLSSSTFTEKNRVPHIKGTALLFDNKIVHASASPRESEYRININFVFRK